MGPPVGVKHSYSKLVPFRSFSRGYTEGRVRLVEICIAPTILRWRVWRVRALGASRSLPA